MKNKLLRTKAIVMILLVISLTFYTAIIFRSLNYQDTNNININKKSKFNYFEFIKQPLLPSVYAQDKVCCQKTKVNSEFSGASCVYTEETNCDLSAGTPVTTSCEQTDYCKPSCCINSNGQCQDNVEAAVCTSEAVGGVARSGACSEIGQCNVGCCNLPSGSSLITQGQCASAVKNFPNLQLDKVFDSSIQDEQQCIEQSHGTEEGCCVLSNSCSFGTRADCSGGDFKLNTLCSYASLGCPVTEKHHTACYKGKVYWFDSSNNRENIYGTNYRQDGQVVPVDQSCKLDHQGLSNNLQCGNCEYALGTICDDATTEFKSKLSPNLVNKVTNQCVSLACVNTEASKKDSQGNLINPWMQGQRRENGESWCEYQSKTGEGNDLVGTRHYIHRCQDGKEVVDEECADRRKEICVQNDVPGNLIDLSNSNQKSLTYASCVPNNWEQCLAANQDTEDCGLTQQEASITYFNLYPSGDTQAPKGPCDVFVESIEIRGGTNVKILKDQENNFMSCILKTACRKKTCEEEVTGNCYFNKNVGLCAPSVPPGTLGKEQEFSKLTEDSEGNNQKLGFSFECKEIWFDPNLGGPECKANCGCQRAYYESNWNNYCTNLGDLGAKYNVVGKYSSTSFITKRTSQGDSSDVAGPADGVTQKSFNLFTTNQKPLSGEFWSLLSSLENLRIIHLSNLKDPDFVKWYQTNTAQWLFATATTGVALGVSALAGAFATGSPFIGPLAEGIAEASRPIIGAGILGTAPLWLTVLVFAVIALALYFIFDLFFGGDQEEVNYQFTCNPYSPPSKGLDCELCNDKTKFRECTDYLCKSLGKACKLINENSPGNQTCIWENPGDTLPIIIEPLPIAPRTLNDFILTPPSTGKQGGYEFKEILKEFESVKVGIKTSTLDRSTNKLKKAPSTCKISRKINFDYETEGGFFTGADVALFEHERTIPIALTGIKPDEDRIELETGKENTFYVKCESVNGIINTNSYFIKMKLDVGPDLSPPLIRGFNLQDNSFIKYNLAQTNLILYYEDQTGVANSKTGFTGGCKYSELDQDYNLMENNMSCQQSKLTSGPNQGKFACSTNLKLNSNQDNIFYFRCRDVSPRLNVNTQSAVLHLKSSQQLKIIEKGPSGDVLTTKVNLTLKTDEGAENGKATCYYAGGPKELITKDLTFSVSGIKFVSTNSNQHETKLSLQNEKDYLFYVWCRDIAGNEAKDKIEFHVTTPDLIIEDAQPNDQTFYTDKIQLKVITTGGIQGNGDATCSYNDGINGFFNEDKQILQDRTIQTKNITLIVSGLTYNVSITCSDQYKTAKQQISFTVNYAAYPQIIRLYKTQNLLNILLDNPAICRYSNDDPNFDFDTSNLKMADLGNAGVLKQAPISSSVIYIKCKDTRTNKFSPVYKVYP